MGTDEDEVVEIVADLEDEKLKKLEIEVIVDVEAEDELKLAVCGFEDNELLVVGALAEGLLMPLKDVDLEGLRRPVDELLATLLMIELADELALDDDDADLVPVVEVVEEMILDFAKPETDDKVDVDERDPELWLVKDAVTALT